MPVGDIIEIRVACDMAPQLALNSLFYKITSVTGVEQGNSAIADAVNTSWAPAYKAILNNNAFYHGVRVQKVWPLPPSPPTTRSGSRGVGTGGAAALPRSVCGIVTWQTAFAGRAYRGRTYYPFPSEQFNDDTTGNPTAAYITALDTLAVLQMGGLPVGAGGNITTLTRVIVHRSTHLTDAVIARRTNSKWAQQRRRGDYGQPNALPAW